LTKCSVYLRVSRGITLTFYTRTSVPNLKILPLKF